MADETKTTPDEELEDEELDDQEQDGESAGDDGAGAKGTGAAGKSGKTFTQAQVTTMMTREKNQGRAAALRELGIDPKDTKTMAAVKAYLESQKTQEQKDAEAQAEAQDALDKATARAVLAEAKAEAMAIGVKPNYVDDAVALAMSKMSEVEGTDLKTILGELKTKYAIWFEAEEEDGKGANNKGTAGQRGTGSSVKHGKENKGGKEQGMGARLAARRTQKAGQTSSYWSHDKK